MIGEKLIGQCIDTMVRSKHVMEQMTFVHKSGTYKIKFQRIDK